MGIIYGPLNVICSFYFDSNLALATGIATSGAGAGVLLISFVTNLIEMKYGWRGSLTLFACASPLTLALVLMIMIVPNRNHTYSEIEGNDVQAGDETTDAVLTIEQVTKHKN